MKGQRKHEHVVSATIARVHLHCDGKDTEKVFLVPELCEFTGFCEAIREDKVLMTEALKQCKVSPPDRLAGMCSLATQMMQNSTMHGGHSSLVCSGGTAQDWSMSLDRFPQEVEGRTFDSVEVCFGLLLMMFGRACPCDLGFPVARHHRDKLCWFLSWF